MSETQDVPGKAYPEDFDALDAALSKSDVEIKLQAGDKVRFRIISGPVTFQEFYYETGEKTQTGKPKKKRIAIPHSSQLPGYPFKVQSMVEVVMMDGPSKGMHRLFKFGPMIGKQLKKIKEDWGSTRNADIIVEREGSGQNDTKYPTRGVAPTLKELPDPKFDLEHAIRFSTKEDIDKMPPPVQAGPAADSLSQQITHPQVDLIDNLLKQKELSSKWLLDTIARKFDKKAVSDLTMGEASKLIDVLKDL